MTEDASLDTRAAEVYRSAGQGVFAGVLAALGSHWIWGANLVVMVFVYGFSMSRLRGWPELGAILTMVGTTVLYFAMYEIIGLESVTRSGTIGLSALALALFVVYVATVAALVDRARNRALHDTEAMQVDVARSQHWEERYYARLRVRWAADEPLWPPFSRACAWAVTALVVAAWFSLVNENRMVASVAWGVVFFQTIVIGRIAQYSRRLAQPRGAEVLARAERPHILFLRPFALDALPVDPMDSSAWYTDVLVFTWVRWTDKRTFEEHLAATFEDLGPVIAIGRPGEELAPLGAAREYADDASWQALVLDRAATSQFVIVELDATPGLVWEIDRVSALVGLQRMLIVLPPSDDLYETRPPEWYERWAALQHQFPFLPGVSKDTAAVLYGDDNQPILVAGHKNSIPRSLEAIKKAWLEQRTRVLQPVVVDGSTEGRP